MLDTRAFLERANLLLSQGRPAEAETWIKKALETEPENDYALSVLARSYYDRKRLDEGIEVMQRALSLDPDNAYHFYLLAFGYYQKNVHVTAINYITKAITLDPYNAEFRGLLAYIYIDEKEFKKALEKADEGLAIDAENITCLNARSMALNKLRMTDEAIATMQDALAKHPDNEFTHATVGWNYLEKGRHKDATHHFREALRIDPGYQNARSGLKEALKSKIPPYKWLLRFNFWLQNKGKNFRWIFLISIFVGVRLIVSLSKADKDMENLGVIVAGAYFIFVATSWIINPLANSFLLFHKDGKYALDHREKWNAIGFMTCVAAGIGFLILSSLPTISDKDGHLVACGAILLSLCIPAGHMDFPIKRKGNKLSQWLAIALIGVALASVIAALLGMPSIEMVFVSYFVLFVIYTWTSAF